MTTRKRLIIAFSLLFGVATVAVIGYLLIGGPSVSLLDAIYMAVVTLSGVGYGEIVDTAHNPILRVFNIFIVLIGVASAVYLFSELTAYLVEGELRHLFRRSRMKKRIVDLKQHFIVCGLGETGRHVTDELRKTHTPFVVVESSNEAVTRLVEGESDAYADLLYLVGDATDEKLLEQAGLDVAAGLIATLPSDKDNLVITVVVRQKNPSIRIVCRCTDLSFSSRMLKAGANSTVSPNHIGGLRMASELLRPSVVGFLDLMLQEKSRTLRIDEISVSEKSSWLGSMIAELKLGDRYNLLPLAVKGIGEADSQLVINPPSTTKVSAGTVIIVMGDTDNLIRARADANG
ncbi:MAG: potassium channel protein [Candidatus Korobacteraceae bacterium]